MTARLNPRLTTSLGFFSQIAGATAVVVGCSVLVGWGLDSATLKSILPDKVTMKANTALGFLLGGLSLSLLRKDHATDRIRRLGQVGAGMVALLGLLTLGEYVFGMDLNIDQLLFREASGAAGTSHPGRMAPNAALNFLLIGTALLLLDVETRHGRPTEALTCTAASVSLVGLIGYAYRVEPFYGIPFYTQMAVHTALTSAILCVGILFARPESGLMRIVTSDSPGGVLTRRLLPAAIVIPALLGWLTLEGQQAGLFGTESRVSVLVVSSILLLAILTSVTSRSLDRAHTERQRAEQQFRTVADTAHDAIISADSWGNIAYLNNAAELIFGYSATEAIGKPLTILMPERFHDPHRQGLMRFLSTGESRVIGKTVELTGRRKDGREFPLELSLASWKTGGETFFTGILRDITARKQDEARIKELNEELRVRAFDLEAANKELEAFSYSASHDLRAPLRSIEGFSQALLEDYAGRLDEDGQDNLERVRAASQRMAQLIDDLLALSRVSRTKIRREPVDLSALAETIAAELQQSRPERAVTFVIAAGQVSKGDSRLLRIVLENLLGNAWKFTSRHPRATIEFGSTERNGKRAYFIRDDGAGFDMTYAEKLFGPFQRLHGANEFPGTGIGLATVERIIHRHGGRVWAEGAVERGATFYFTL